jgi:hypothetical protein
VEAQFTEYGYDFAVLSATAADGLQAWLDDNGYAIPAGGEDILQSYIDAGVYFLAVKVNLDVVEQVDGWLPPIQLRYASPSLSLPIRIGTISSAGAQEVVVYTLTPVAEGEVSITNFPELAGRTSASSTPPPSRRPTPRPVRAGCASIPGT